MIEVILRHFYLKTTFGVFIQISHVPLGVRVPQVGNLLL